MKGLEWQIVDNLQRGHQRAIKGSVIAQRLNLKSDRSIRLAIRELIRHGHPICASVEPPLGYFLAETREEIQKYMAILKSRLIEDALRRRDIKRAGQSILDPNQLVMKF